MSDNRSGAFLGGVILGAVAGAVAGLLLAPRTGRETRQVLKKSADALPEVIEDLTSSLQLHTHKLSDTALQNWEQTLERLKAAIAAGQEASLRELSDLQTDGTHASHLASTAAKSSVSRE
jgi:gas vesicle protein